MAGRQVLQQHLQGQSRLCCGRFTVIDPPPSPTPLFVLSMILIDYIKHTYEEYMVTEKPVSFLPSLFLKLYYIKIFGYYITLIINRQNCSSLALCYIQILNLFTGTLIMDQNCFTAYPLALCYTMFNCVSNFHCIVNTVKVLNMNTLVHM